jgi:hypothetical protein
VRAQHPSTPHRRTGTYTTGVPPAALGRPRRPGATGGGGRAGHFTAVSPHRVPYIWTSVRVPPGQPMCLMDRCGTFRRVWGRFGANQPISTTLHEGRCTEAWLFWQGQYLLAGRANKRMTSVVLRSQLVPGIGSQRTKVCVGDAIAIRNRAALGPGGGKGAPRAQ